MSMGDKWSMGCNSKSTMVLLQPIMPTLLDIMPSCPYYLTVTSTYDLIYCSPRSLKLEEYAMILVFPNT